MPFLLGAFALLLLCAPLPALAAEPRQAAQSATVGDMDVVVFSLAERDQDAKVLNAGTPQAREDVARVYPGGAMPNTLNVQLVKSGDRVVLVDTGLPATLPALLQGLKARGVAPEDVTHVVITHAHGDHVGGLTAEGRAVFPGARVLFSEREADFWLNPANEVTAPERARAMFGQLPQILAPYAGRVDRVPVEQTFLSGLRLIPAYGHTPGHVGVLAFAGVEPAPGAVLFWGDLVHGMPLQLLHPDVSTSYDLNPEDSIEARKTLLDKAARGQWLVGGVHTPGAAFWTLAPGTSGAYEAAQVAAPR